MCRNNHVAISNSLVMQYKVTCNIIDKDFFFLWCLIAVLLINMMVTEKKNQTILTHKHTCFQFLDEVVILGEPLWFWAISQLHQVPHKLLLFYQLLDCLSCGHPGPCHFTLQVGRQHRWVWRQEVRDAPLHCLPHGVKPTLQGWGLVLAPA